MKRTPPDMVQSALIAANLQVLLRVPEANQDAARVSVAIPTDYDMHGVSSVPGMMVSRGLVRRTAVCRSRRPDAKCSKSHSYTLACGREVALDYLRSLQHKLGPAFVVVTDAAMRIAEPRVIARLRKPASDAPGQMLLPWGTE